MLIDEIEKRGISISLRIYEPSNLITNWEVQEIIDNPEIFEDFFAKHPLKEVKTFDDYYLYLLSLKLQSFAEVIPLLIHEEHKAKIAKLTEQAEKALQAIDTGSIIRFINSSIEEIFNNSKIVTSKIRFVTIDIIAKYNTGISKESFIYLCDHFPHLLIDRFDDFEVVFECAPDLFEKIFPSGKLDDIDSFRFGKVLEIWQHIVKKRKSNLKDTVERNIPVLFADIAALAGSVTIDNVMQVEGVIRKFYRFLRQIKSPLANQFGQYAKKTETLLKRRIIEQGELIKYEIPVGQIVKRWESIESWELRLLDITHDKEELDGDYSFISRLDKEFSNEPSMTDWVSTNIPTDDYFTLSHQHELSLRAAVGGGTVLKILGSQKTRNDYFSLMVSSIGFISEELSINHEDLEQDTNQLISMIQLIFSSHSATDMTVHSLCYGAAMFACAFTEKLLRLFYTSLTKDRQYIPTNKATLGEVLNENNKDICCLFGLNHIKNLSFFLMRIPPKNIGRNIRNSLAHWSDLSVDMLTPMYVAQVLWLFTDVLNTVFWYLLKNNLEAEKS